jgi:hypothetical protein
MPFPGIDRALAKKEWKTMSESAVWTGCSGAHYSLRVSPLDARLSDCGGVFVFARQSRTGDGWVAICVGETESFSEFIAAHPFRQCTRDHAATHIHVLSNADPPARRAIVRDLIGRWHPPCNQTLNDSIVFREHVVISS